MLSKVLDQTFERPMASTPKKAKRDRAQVAQFDPSAAGGDGKRAKSSHFSPARVGEVGSGAAIGDIEVVCGHIGKLSSKHDLLTAVHMLCYGRKGKQLERKRNLRKFSGFTFAVDSAPYRKCRAKLLSPKPWTTACLHDLCTLFDIKRGAAKEETVDVIMAFMMAPKAN